jgi:CheY-like chemotaxis protein
MTRIMVVDDEKDVVDSVLTILGTCGYETMHAYSGKECLVKIKKNKPDLILLDVMMPGMVAREVIEEINKDKTLKEIKIIYLTAVTASDKEKKEMIKVGHIVDFIEKPFDMKDLLKRIKEALSKG